MQAEARENSAYYFYEAGARYAKRTPMSTCFRHFIDRGDSKLFRQVWRISQAREKSAVYLRRKDIPVIGAESIIKVAVNILLSQERGP